MRVFAVSDVHTDYPANLAWVESLSSTEYQQDVLIVAGDVSDDVALVRRTLALFASKCPNTFFVPGNHELWVRRGESKLRDSLGKLELLQALCTELGVHTQPKCVAGVWIAPIMSWYHASFDTEPDLPGAPDVQKVMVDFHACRWPEHLSAGGGEALAQHFDSMNEPALSNLDAILDMEADAAGGQRPPLITFSHFLPLQMLLPEKRMLFQPNLSKAVGSDYIARRIEELRPLVHIFGHTHFQWDATIDGVRYCQWPLGYPKERRRRSGPEGDAWKPLLVYDTENGVSPEEHCYWSAYYKANPRDPSNLQPAPWVQLN